MSVITEIMLDTMELLSLVMSWPRERLSENDRDPASHVVTWGSMEEHALQVARVAVYGRGMRFQADPPDGKVIAAPPGALEQIGSKKEADLTQWRYDPVIRARWWFRRILRPDHSGGHIVGRESIFRVVVEEKTVGPTLEETGKLMREKLEAAREKARLDHLRSFENIALKSTE